ncbi:uncharacterized protein BJX67DRAFT_378582 [Aspergillus lucknowensis]|uniref:Uncharacterized protein n=1 Tax=Aspergillus lucknowensis TaxID=176173 RepID=A0ABR4M072_9EURO
MSKHTNTSSSLSPTIHITILTIATLLILSLLILIIGPSRILSDSSANNCPQIYITSTPHPSQAPASTTTDKPWNRVQHRIYNDSKELETIHKTPETPETWETLLIPPAGGGIRVDEATIDHLDDYPEIKARNGAKVGLGIAMMHQLHCLIVLRGLIFKENSVDAVNSTSDPHMLGDKAKDEDHWSHCFDYIAQALLCAADDTLEKPKKVVQDGDAWWHVDGVGAVHQCKDPRPLWEMSMRTEVEPADMSRWREGTGAREYFADELKEGYRYDIPDVYDLGLLGS